MYRKLLRLHLLPCINSNDVLTTPSHASWLMCRRRPPPLQPECCFTERLHPQHVRPRPPVAPPDFRETLVPGSLVQARWTPSVDLAAIQPQAHSRSATGRDAVGLLLALSKAMRSHKIELSHDRTQAVNAMKLMWLVSV